MVLMAAVFAVLTDPIRVASLAREVVESCHWVLIIEECHALECLVTVELHSTFSEDRDCASCCHIEL